MSRSVRLLASRRRSESRTHRPKRITLGRGEGEEARMPYVNIKITREGATAEQKATLIRKVTELLRDELGKNPSTTVVVIDEVDTDNWGIGGESVTVRRKRGS
ncbi:4-oxalocrotonate tautomerase family protein [Anaeromyxobacter sp. K]|nr:4-oxalocrotonate tautomerase family protein [Anaeromyxobacter sp. K]